MNPWDPNYIRKSKTTTSTQVKARYNRKHYDVISIRAGRGSRAAVRSLAELRGLSMAAYIRALLIADANAADRPELAATLGGSGDIAALADMLDKTPRQLYDEAIAHRD